MESIDTLLNTVAPGDFIRLHLDGEDRTLAGYVWYTSREKFLKVHGRDVRSHWAENQVIDTLRSNVYISALNPDSLDVGNDSFRRGVQLIGLDVSIMRKATIQGIKIKGYEILEKSKNWHLPFFLNP